MSIRNYLTPTKKYKLLTSSVHGVYRLVNSTYQLRELVSRLSKLICQIYCADRCTIALLDQSKKYSLLRCMVTSRKKYIVDRKTRVSNRIEKKIIRMSSSVKQGTLLGLPLVFDDVMGFIIIERVSRGCAFDAFDQELLVTISEQAITGIRNLQLYEEQQRIVLGSIKSLVKLMDTRIPQEYTHSPYFSRLVAAIAQQMHLDEKQIESLKYASLLHDAGKMEVPLEILTKSSKLTAREFRIIKRHPLKGAQILAPLQVLKPVIPIIVHHHEKYDGTGYPSRLKKRQIPQGARIMSVADAFEAMVYGRPYRERMDIPSAVKEIKKKSGSQFDPKVVEAFLKVVKRIKTKNYLASSKHGKK